MMVVGGTAREVRRRSDGPSTSEPCSSSTGDGVSPSHPTSVSHCPARMHKLNVNHIDIRPASGPWLAALASRPSKTCQDTEDTVGTGRLSISDS